MSVSLSFYLSRSLTLFLSHTLPSQEPPKLHKRPASLPLFKINTIAGATPVPRSSLPTLPYRHCLSTPSSLQRDRHLRTHSLLISRVEPSSLVACRPQLVDLRLSLSHVLTSCTTYLSVKFKQKTLYIIPKTHASS